MEFNELIHRQLNAKEALLKRLQGELIDLRGPVCSIIFINNRKFSYKPELLFKTLIFIV